MRRVLVIGGYGTFGAHVCRELTRLGVTLTIAGRDRARAQAFSHELGIRTEGLAVNVTRPETCRAVLMDHGVVVNCAGPFRVFDTSLLDVCLDAGCHYADIADDRGYVALVRGYHARFQQRGLAAIYGCSTFPGISGALALLARGGQSLVVRARATLFIGNRNPKGEAAIHSLLASLGQPIAAPQGSVKCFHDRELVELPAPFGRRAVFSFLSPDYDILPALIGARSVSVKVGFESRAATYVFALIARMAPGSGKRAAQLLALLSRPLSYFGSSGGAVLVELFLADGTVRKAAIVAHNGGQRMAALPCALAARALCADHISARGALTVYEFLGVAPLLRKLVEAGFELHSPIHESSGVVATP